MKKHNFQVGRIIDIIGGLMLAAMVLLSMFNVSGDWLFDRRFGAIEEFILAAFVWVVYVSMGELYKSGDHIYVDLLEKSLPEKANRILRIFIDMIVLIVSGVVTYYGIILTFRSITKYTPVLKIPYFFIDFAVVIGFAFLVKYSLQNIVRNVKLLAAKKVGEKTL